MRNGKPSTGSYSGSTAYARIQAAKGSLPMRTIACGVVLNVQHTGAEVDKDRFVPPDDWLAKLMTKTQEAWLRIDMRERMLKAKYKERCIKSCWKRTEAA